MTIKEIKEKLQVSGTEFNINGKLDFQKGPDGEWGDYPKVFITSGEGKTVAINSRFEGMNVTKFGPTCVTLYTFDMFNRRISGKIKYSDIKFVTMEQFECENPFSTENSTV